MIVGELLLASHFMFACVGSRIKASFVDEHLTTKREEDVWDCKVKNFKFI